MTRKSSRWNIFNRSPKPDLVDAVQRLQADASTRHAIRAYDAARNTRLNGDWVDSRLDSNRELYQSLGILRSASREAERNNGLYQRMLSMHVGYIIGRGFQIQALPRNYDGKVDQVASRAIEARWRSWAKSRVTVDGRHNLLSACKLLVRSWFRDGEIFIRWVLRDGQMKLQIFESDYCPEMLEQETRLTLNGRTATRTMNGISFDDDGVRVAYHMAREHPGSNYFGRTFIPDTETIPADEVMHLYSEERAGQLRGVPIGAASFEDLRQLKGYAKAELAAARANAARPVSIERKPDAEVGFSGDKTTAEGEVEFDGSPGAWTKMPEGWTVNWSPVQHPSGSYGTYVDAVTRQLAATWGVSHALLTRNLSQVNYSSMKVEGIDLNNYFTEHQDQFVMLVMEPIFQMWLDFELMSSRIQVFAKGGASVALPYAKKDKFSDVNFVRPPFPSLDSEKEVAAERAKVKLGIKSLQQVTLEMEGRELDDVADERRVDREILDLNGLTDVLEQEITQAQVSADGKSGVETDEDGVEIQVVDESPKVDTDTVEQNTINVSELALNGIQVTAMLTVLEQVVLGKLPKVVAKVVLMTSFAMSQENANAMIDPLEEKPDMAPSFGQKPSSAGNSPNREEPAA